MSDCGAHCQCAGDSPDKEEICPPPKGGISFDANGQCACGKAKEECCLLAPHCGTQAGMHVRSQTQAGHKEIIRKEKIDENPAVFELCKPHGKRHLCEG